MKKLALCLILGSIYTAPSFALELPKGSPFDNRITHITYNPQQVVQINAVIGVATHIVLEKGESYVTHVFGDGKAYAFTKVDNHLFIKPSAEMADTNLIVVTDRRTYNFRLQLMSTRQNATYEIAFTYPDSILREAKERREKADLEQRFKKAPAKANLNYTMSGDMDIAPINAWDDNRFTYFKFPGNRDIPGIYLVDEEGNESIVNRWPVDTANRIYKVEKTNPKFVLRLGNRALAIWNDSFDPNGIVNNSRTASPAVQRYIKEADSNGQ